MDWLHWRMKEESVPQSDDLFTFVQFCCSFPSFNKCGIQLHFCETVFCIHPFVAQQSSTAFIISHLWFICLRVIFIIYVTYKSDVSFILISFTNDRLKGVCQLLASSLNLLATICLFYKRICRFDGSFPLSTMLFNNLHCSLVVLLLLLSKINSFLLKFVGFFACFFPPLNVWNRKLYQWYVCISSNLSKHISGSEYKQTNEKMKQIMMTTNYLLF